MDTKLLIALIAAGSALLVALVSLATAVITSFTNARTSRALEAMKQSFEGTGPARAILDGETRDALEALKSGLHCVQRLKDEIQLMLSAVGSSLLVTTARQRMSTARGALFDAYERFHSHLADAEAAAFHRAKDLALAAEEIVVSSVGNRKNASDLPSDARDELLQLRSELTDLQHVLRDCRTERLIQESFLITASRSQPR